MKKILVAVEAYPDNAGSKALMYVHVRNKAYKQAGIDVTVLNFSSNNAYAIDGIQVIPLSSYTNKQYDALICHAANLKHHYRFLQQHGNDFPTFVFFFHGQEILRVTEDYPQEFKFVKSKTSWTYKCFRNIYDDVKLQAWHKYFLSVVKKSHFIFVSNWLKDRFFRNLDIKESQLDGHFSVINNSVGKPFETHQYSPQNIEYDYITVRSDLDGAKYGIDIVDAIARAHKELKFAMIGKGKYYEFNEKPANIELIQSTLTHEELLAWLNKARCALMPTRQDTQGVMSCEMATYGMPLITSDIPICHEIFDPYGTVVYIDNENPVQSFEKATSAGVRASSKKLYLQKDTVAKEILFLLALE